jgi:hypothetical protein
MWTTFPKSDDVVVVAGLATRGEVLVSGTVKDLVVGSGIVFSERGEHQLQGVPGSWRLFAVQSS